MQYSSSDKKQNAINEDHDTNQQQQNRQQEQPLAPLFSRRLVSLFDWLRDIDAVLQQTPFNLLTILNQLVF